MEVALAQAVHASLANHLYPNATFLAERLFAEQPNEATREVLGRCYLREGVPEKAQPLLMEGTSDQNRYLLACACLQLKKYTTAEQALLKRGVGHAHSTLGIGSARAEGPVAANNPQARADADEVANGAAGFVLLGQVYRCLERREDAVTCFKAALDLDPFLWCAYEALCDLGESVDAKGVFVVAKGKSGPPRVPELCEWASTLAGAPETHGEAHTPHPPTRFLESEAKEDNRGARPFGERNLLTPLSSVGNAPSTQRGAHHKQPHNLTPVSLSPLPLSITPVATPPSLPSSFSSPSTPPSLPSSLTPPSHPLDHPAMPVPPRAPSKRGRERKDARHERDERPRKDGGGRMHDESPMPFRLPPMSLNTPVGGDVGASSGGGGGFGFDTPSPALNQDGPPQHRRKVVHDSNPAPRVGARLAQSRSGPHHPGASETPAPTPHYSLAIANTPHGEVGSVEAMWLSSVASALDLLAVAGNAYRLLRQFQCAQAIEAFRHLPFAHYNTGWALCCVATAHTELVQYQEAERVFQKAWQVEPNRFEGLEVYSTVLWQLRNEVRLSYLAHFASQTHPRRPQALCAVGNLFSLQKDHKAALKFFLRAIQVAPSFVYAHTLAGHEFAATEDFEKSLTFYRKAIRLDPRHHNAWYGLGSIYFRQEKYELAYFHFNRALQINPSCSVLYTLAGQALEESSRHSEALRILERGIQVDPHNHVTQYRRANVLFRMGRHAEALLQLQQLSDEVPRESSIHFLLGKVHQAIGNNHQALKHYVVALDLAPKDNTSIRAAMESIADEEGQGLDSIVLSDHDECMNEGEGGEGGEGKEGGEGGKGGGPPEHLRTPNDLSGAPGSDLDLRTPISPFSLGFEMSPVPRHPDA